MPTFARRTDRGVLEDVDGNRLIDFDQASRGDNRGRSSGARRRCDPGAGREFDTHLLRRHEVRRVHRGRRTPERTDSGRFPKKTALFNSGRRPSRTPSARPEVPAARQWSASTTPSTDAPLTMGLTAKVALQGRLRSFAPEFLPGPRPHPQDGLDGEAAAERTISQIRWGLRRRCHHQAHSGRRRVHRSGARLSSARSSAGAVTTAPSSSPTRFSRNRSHRGVVACDHEESFPTR